MKVSQSAKCFIDYHRMNSKKNTVRNYEYLFTGFAAQFGDREGESLTSEEILSFLSRLTERARQSTKRLRFSLLRAFFTFTINSGNEKFQNPYRNGKLKVELGSPH
jgi:integrase/recombinase XerD